ncbi:MAG: hypothetical protein ACLT8C_07260 [Akkermansia muciniphila]
MFLHHIRDFANQSGVQDALPFSSKKTGSGTPQVRWREMHQSGLASTVP